MTKFRSRKLAASWLAVSAFSVLSAVSARAQTTASDDRNPAKADEPVALQKFVVTGSNLPSASEFPPNPVTVIGQTEINKSGVTSDLLQVLRKTAPQFSGNANLGVDNGNISSGSTNGGSALALRNAATLVLVNGRRVTSSPVAASGGSVFVDVNAIPIAAIERIEILTDGASAIYGSDAVSGVVNIILKSDYKGAEIGGRYAWTTNQGHYKEKSAYAIAGGEIGNTGFNVTGSFEWTKTDPIFNYQRPFATPSYGTTNFAGVIQTGSFATGNFVGGSYYYLDPSLAAPRAGATLTDRGYGGPLPVGDVLRLFNLSQFVTMLIENEKRIGTLAFDYKFSPKISFFGDLLYSSTQTTSQLNAQPVTVQMRADDPNNILGVDVSVRNRFIDFPRLFIADTDSYRVVLGAKGDLADNWSWESALNHNHAAQDFSNANLVRTAGRIAAVNAGRINLFSRTQPANALDGVFGTAQGKFVSTLSSWDFKLVGAEVARGPAGATSLALGTEYRKEKLTASADPDSQSATFAYDSGTTIDPFAEKRNIWSFFAETQIPLIGAGNRLPGIYELSFIAAVRHERYSDVDDPTVPKFTLTYLPFDDSLRLRATYSESFAAPTLFNLHSPTSIGFTPTLPQFDSNQAQLQTLAVQSLKPSESKSISYGAVWTPKQVKGLTLSLDFFHIKQDDIVSSLGTDGVIQQVFADVETRGAASPYAQFVHVGDFTGPTVSTPGQISELGLDNIYFVIPAASNIGSQKISGFDLKVSYTLSFEEYGKLTWDSTSTYYNKYDIQVAAGAPFTHTAGLVTKLNGTISRWRTYNTLSYQIKDFVATVAHTYYPATRDAEWTPDFAPDGYPETIPAYSVFDASIGYILKGNAWWNKGIKLNVGVNNIGNKLPSKSAAFDTLSNADITEFSPIGRLYYVSAGYKF